MTSLQSRRPLAPGDDDLARELSLHLQTLQELGPSYSDEVAAAFVRHIDRLIDERLEARLAAASHRLPRARDRRDLGAVAAILGLAIPITAVAGGIAGLGGILLVWAAILVIVWRLTK
ncbi:MAG: hypothetical protein QJR03_08125 [Sphaerobacter sp.]|nr:hypothetical protein [Sphaerobacter sp.]